MGVKTRSSIQSHPLNKEKQEVYEKTPPRRTNLGNSKCKLLGPKSSSRLFDKENIGNGKHNSYSSDISTTESSDNESQVNSYLSDISTTGSSDNESQADDNLSSTSNGDGTVSDSSDGESQAGDDSLSTKSDGIDTSSDNSDDKQAPKVGASTQTTIPNLSVVIKREEEEEDNNRDVGDDVEVAGSTQNPHHIQPMIKHEDDEEDNVGDTDQVDNDEIHLVDDTINPFFSADRLVEEEDAESKDSLTEATPEKDVDQDNFTSDNESGLAREEEDDSYDAESKNLMPEKDEDNLTSDNASGDDSSCLPSTVQSYTEKSDEELVAPESNIVTSSDVFPFNAVDIHALLQATLPPTPSSSKTQPIEGVSEQPDKEGCASLANTRDLFGTPFSDNEVSSRIQKRNKDHSFASSSESLENKSSSKLSLGDGSLNLDGTNFFENYKYGGALSPLSDVIQDDNADKSEVLAALLAAKDNTIASQNNALVSMELKLSESQRRAEYFQKECESMKLKLAQSDTANAILQAEKKKRSKEVEDLQDNFSKLSDKNGILKHGLSTKEAEIENLQSQFDALIVENATLKDDHNNLKEEVKSMKDNVNGLTSENSLLKKEFDTAKGRIAVLSDDNAVLVEEKDNLIVVVKSNEDDVNGLTSENASLKEELDKAQVLNNDNAELAKEKERLEGQVVALEKDNSVIVTANAQLEKQLTTAKQEITSLHESNEMLRGEISYAKTEHVTVKQDLEDLIVSSGEKTRINASLKNELANSNDNNNALSEEVKNLKDIVEVLTSNITRLNEESDATKARFVSLKNDKASLAEENLSLEDQVVALEEDKRALYTDNKHLFKHAETLKREKKDFKREIKELNDEIAQKDIDSEMINKALSKEVVEKHKLKEENDQLKKETELWKQREQSLPKDLKRLQDANLL